MGAEPCPKVGELKEDVDAHAKMLNRILWTCITTLLMLVIGTVTFLAKLLLAHLVNPAVAAGL